MDSAPSKTSRILWSLTTITWIYENPRFSLNITGISLTFRKKLLRIMFFILHATIWAVIVIQRGIYPKLLHIAIWAVMIIQRGIYPRDGTQWPSQTEYLYKICFHRIMELLFLLNSERGNITSKMERVIHPRGEHFTVFYTNSNYFFTRSNYLSVFKKNI